MPTRELMRSSGNFYFLCILSSTGAEAKKERTSPKACLVMLLTKVLIRSDCGKCELGSGLGEMLAQSLALPVSDD